MFYKQFSTIIDIVGEDIVDSFDFWLATLPDINQKSITASVVAARLGIKYSIAETLLEFSEKVDILEKEYIVRCPECDSILCTAERTTVTDFLVNGCYCYECDCTENISTDNIYIAYRVKKRPNVSEKAYIEAIRKRFADRGIPPNFNAADSLSNNTKGVYELFYRPSESAYNDFKEMRKKIDLNYGRNTTEKGRVLEDLVCEIFKQINYVKCSRAVKTGGGLIQGWVNQLDCTAVCGVKISASVFDYLSPYFIVECKNEKKKPNNTYLNKLIGIMDTNESQLGILWGRTTAAKTCAALSREQYLIYKNSKRKRILLTFSDSDLTEIIDKRTNLLEYIEFKIFQVTANAFSSTFDEFDKGTNIIENT